MRVTYLQEDVVTPALGDLERSDLRFCDEYMLQHRHKQAKTNEYTFIK